MLLVMPGLVFAQICHTHCFAGRVLVAAIEASHEVPCPHHHHEEQGGAALPDTESDDQHRCSGKMLCQLAQLQLQVDAHAGAAPEAARVYAAATPALSTSRFISPLEKPPRA
jgi:hypothetical protein